MVPRGGAKNRILKNPCLSLTSYLLPCITLARQWHPFSFATATEDECVRVPRMVAGAQCEFIAAESSTYECWLRFESSEKKRLCFSVNDQCSQLSQIHVVKISLFSKLVAFSNFHSFVFHTDCNIICRKWLYNFVATQCSLYKFYNLHHLSSVFFFFSA